MLSVQTKVYILSKYFEVPENEINEEFIQKELLLINDWDEFEELDNEEFCDALVLDKEERESFISIIFEYNVCEFALFVDDFEELLYESDDDYFLEQVQNFIIRLFAYDEEEMGIEPYVSNIELIKNRIHFIFDTKIMFPIKKGIVKVLSPFLKRKYEIKELPFCLEGMDFKYWEEELIIQNVIEHEDELEEI